MNLRRATFERYAKGTSPFVGIPIPNLGTVVFKRSHLQAALETQPNRVIYNRDTKTVTFRNHRSEWKLFDLLGQQKIARWQLRDQLESWARGKRSAVLKRKATAELGKEGVYVRRLREAVAKLKKQRDKIHATAPQSPLNPKLYKEHGDYSRKQFATWIAQKPQRKALAKLAGQKLVHGEPKTWSDFYSEVERITGTPVSESQTFTRVHARRRYRHGLPDYPSRETYLKHLPAFLGLNEKPYEWKPYDLHKPEYGGDGALARHAKARLEYCAVLREQKSLDSQIKSHVEEIASVTAKAEASMRHTLTKPRHEMTIPELIVDSGWWLGTEREWQALPLPEREKIAFERTGCAVAYPTWQRPVECVHTECQILRGELPKIALTNRILRAEAQSGWLRFHRTDIRGTEGRKKLAKLFRAYRKLAREKGQYDPWKLSWEGIVYAGVQS